MLKFIWNSWWRNKERFILLIIGALIVSIGLSYLVGITQTNNATVVDELQKRWKSSYDIVVRPPDSRSVTEDKNLLEPNYLSGLAEGITLEQYEQIKEMSDIDIAAPIAMIGYMRNSIELETLEYTEPGIYRLMTNEVTHTGIDQEDDMDNRYFTVGWSAPNDASEYGISTYKNGVDLSYGSEVLIAGVDPEAEAALVGINDAMSNDVNGQFLSSDNEVSTYEVAEGIQETNIPVIISSEEFVDAEITYTLKKLDIPFDDDPGPTMEKVKEEGGKAYLDNQSGTQTDQFHYTTEETHSEIINQIREGVESSDFSWVAFKPSPVNYREVTSPYAERWPFTYEVEPYIVPEDSLLAADHSYRPISMFSEDSTNWPRIQLDFKGVFDPKKLNISKDPLTELPMETYFPSKADWVLDKENNPVNPPQEMKPQNNPYGFLTKPPMVLTTIDAASEVLGEAPISAIRLKINGVDELTEESEQTLQAVAKDIEEKTGLTTDITLGSSPQPALTHIPGVGEQESIGWVEQPWIKLGSSVTIFQESKIGMSGVIASVIAVAIVYVFTSNIIMMYARKKEFAVLLSVGWRPNQLTKLLFIEAGIIGAFVSMISWVILGFIYVTNDIQTSGWRLLLIGIFGIAVYVLGALIPGILVRRISPYETMKTGEVSRRKRRLFKTASIVGMSLNNLLAKWKRSLLSMIAIALPTSLLVFFLFVTFQLRGTMFTTWLGEYVAMEVGPMHYVAMGVAIAIAILTTAEIIWQNVAERQPEFAVLKAFGWQNKTVRRLVLIEGGLNGLIAGIFGLGIAFIVIWAMYGHFPMNELPFLLVTILIPILTGISGAVVPAGKAAKLQPYHGLTGGVVNSKKTEKRFQYVFATLGVGLFIGIVIVLTQALPDTQQASSSNTDNVTSTTQGTEGDVTDTVSSEDNEVATDLEVDADEKAGTTDPIQEKMDNADRIWDTGKTYEYWEEKYTYNVVSTPDDIEPVRDDTELISITSELITPEPIGVGGYTIYRPQVHYILIDDQGNEYKRVSYKTLEAENWKQEMRIGTPGRVKMLLTYEVPKDAEQIILYGFHDSWVDTGFVVVKIKP